MSDGSIKTETVAQQWKMEDNAADAIVSGTIIGELVGGNTADVQAALGGHGSFHLDGAGQYVKINLVPDLMRADEIAHLWTKYASNPVLSDAASIQFGQVIRNQSGGWYFFGAYNGGCTRWSSTDLITWTDPLEVFTGGGVGAWDELIQVVCPFRKPDNSWVMLYRGAEGSGGGLQMGMATSANGTTWTRKDNGGVNDGLISMGGNYDPTCVMLIDSTYHIYVNGLPDHGHTNLYTTTDFSTFTPYASNPVFDNGFCGTVWKHGSYYYMLIPRDLGTSASILHEHGLALYRCSDQYFAYGVREFLGYVVVNDQTYDDRYLDTPSVPVTDVYRDTFGAEFGDNLHVIYSGDLTAIKQNLVSSTFTELAARPAIPESETEIYHHAKRSFSFNMQLDSFTDNDVIFSIGSTVGDSNPVQLAHFVSTTVRLLLGGGYRVGTGGLAANVPYHIVIVDDILTTYVYLNQVLTATIAFENPSTDANWLFIGNGEGDQPIDGYVWDFRIYPGALTQEQVTRLYQTGRIE